MITFLVVAAFVTVTVLFWCAVVVGKEADSYIDQDEAESAWLDEWNAKKGG